MSIHIISVLGTSLYEPVYYQGKKEPIETEFIQAAVINEYKDQLKDSGKVTIFVTDFSEVRNWNDRIYSGRDAEFAAKWISDKKGSVKEGEKKSGLHSVILEQFPEIADRVECVKIPDMKNEAEIWDVFGKIYDCIDEKDDLVFDITHSFRSIPMLAVTVINYAKVLKQCHLEAVYYGAYDAEDNSVEEGKKCAPIIDLTTFNEILEWTYAADSFVNYGNVNKMKEVYKDRIRRIPDEEKREWNPMNIIINNMENLSLGIATCRGANSLKLPNRKNKDSKSVLQAYLRLKSNVNSQDMNKGKDIIPMMKLIEYATQKFHAFDTCQWDYEVGIEIVRWSIRYRMVQQGYTALEATIKTYICERYGLDDILFENRETIVSSMITACHNDIPDDREKMFENITRNDKRFSVTYANLSDEMKRVTRCMILELPKELLKLAQSVKQYRNDINHMGFNENCRTAEVLEGKLKESFDQFVKIVDDMKDIQSASIVQKGFTHAGVFHADDVFATALLKIVYPDIVIERGTKVPDDYDGIVYDIGYGKYDHHQADRKSRETGVPYAAFGLLWEEYGPELVGEEMAAAFDKEFVQRLDLSDNTGENEAVCSLIAGYNSLWDEDSDQDEQFMEAVNVAKEMLERQIKKMISKKKAAEEVRNQISQAKDHILILEKAMPWKEALVDTDILYVIMRSIRGGYNVQAVPKTIDTTELKKAFPKAWCGAAKEDLVKMTGIETFTFCHFNGFLCVAETLEDAVKIAEDAVNA